MATKCELCDRSDIRFAVSENRAAGIKTDNYCSDLHLVLHVLKKFSGRIKAETTTGSVRLYQTSVTILTKLSKAFEKEWKATAKK